MELHKDDTRAILEYLGFKVDRAYKFKMRASEHTASASINPKNGMIKDFGSGWGGDIVSFYQYVKNCSPKQAFKDIATISKELNINIQSTKSSTHSNDEFSQKRESQKENKLPMPITQSYIDKFKQERKENFSRYWELLSKTLPTFDADTKKAIAEKFEIGYSKQADRLIMPIKDEAGLCRTLWKYNPKPAPMLMPDGNILNLSKYTFTKNRPRKNFIFNYKDFSEVYRLNLNEPIFFAEGEKDCLNMIASGLRAVSLGSASTKLGEKFINEFKGAKIVIAYDYDDAGHQGAQELAQQLTGIASSIEIIDWQRIAKKAGIVNKLFDKFDFTDFLCATAHKGKSKEQTFERG